MSQCSQERIQKVATSKSPSEIEASFVFEAKKVGIVQDKNGYVLKLVIHPDDIPDALLRSWVGARYRVGMAELDDQEQVVIPPADRKMERLITSAGMMCKEPKFWKYLGEVYGYGEPDSELKAKNMLCSYLGIESRAELATNKEAAKIFESMRDEVGI